MRRNIVLSLLSLVLLIQANLAQPVKLTDFFRNIVIKADTMEYSLLQNTIVYNGERTLAFEYRQENEVCEVFLFPRQENGLSSIRLLESGDYMLVDSIHRINNEYYRFKVQFKNLTHSQFVQFMFAIGIPRDSIEHLIDLPLFPYTQTSVKFYPGSEELFIGEEKIFELITNNMDNVHLTNGWIIGEDYDYMVSEQYGQLRLHLLPHNLGRKKLIIYLQTNKPSLERNQKTRYDLPPIEFEFSIKMSRLAFLNLDRKELTLDEVTQRNGIEIQMDDHRALLMNKTYRVEDQENPGGTLIAEIFTRNSLANNRVLCLVRVYNLHRQSEGYLYIKDGDDAKFITNLNITPKTSIKKVSLMHEGGDWTENLTVNPGEVIDVRIDGDGLHKAKFSFEDLTDLSGDSSLRSETTAFYKLRVPINVSRRRIVLFNYAENTGYTFTVKEYQVPKPFDYIQINYGDIDRTLASLKSPVLYSHTIQDVVFSFLPRRIDDDPGKLFGKQYLKIDVKITNSKNQLVEMHTIDNIVVCPGENSPRYLYYDGKDCITDELSLNNILSRKTYDLDEWSKIELDIENKREKYSDEIYTKKIDLYLKKAYKFDIDVSFPAGLITVYKQPVSGSTTGEKAMAFGSLSGISMAIMGQFSFYHPDKIATFRPYKLGVGFLALNAFNFSDNTVNRDVGLVIVGSIYPINREAKLTFPLYIGGGYLLKENQPFFLIGPGIRISL